MTHLVFVPPKEEKSITALFIRGVRLELLVVNSEVSNRFISLRSQCSIYFFQDHS